MENVKKSVSTASPESITYITLLAALQVVLNCQLELEGTIYTQGKTKEKVREALNMLSLTNSRNRDRIWELDPMKAADMMFAVQKIGEAISKNDGMVLHLVTKICRMDFDLSRVKLVEVSEATAKKLAKQYKTKI
jgi:hypothetical protein